MATSGFLEDVESSSSRPALQQKFPSAPLSIPKRVRRKSSFVLGPDSSEDFPSPHASIYEAFNFSAPNSDETDHIIELLPLKHCSAGSTNEGRGNNENIREPAAPRKVHSIEYVRFRYGHGTPLGTITEQRSYTTISTLTRTKSADDMPSFPSVRTHDNSVLSNRLRRKQSFSLDDAVLVKSSYHEVCSLIEREVRKPLQIDEIYAEPKSPMHPPVYRPSTPPGMPSWTAAQSLPRTPPRTDNQSKAPNRFQRFFGVPTFRMKFSCVLPLSTNSEDRTVSASTNDRPAPRFRPPRSVYGLIDQHPFANAPVAKVNRDSQPTATTAASTAPSTTAQAVTTSTLPRKRRLGQRVRFTPSATARDSEMISLQAAIEASSASALHPLAPPVEGRMDNSNVASKQKKCPHRKGRQATFEALNHQQRQCVTTTASNDYAVIPSRTPGPQNLPPPLVSVSRPSLPSQLRLVPSSSHGLDIEEFENFSLNPSRTVSVSSTAHLMTTALRTGSPLPPTNSNLTTFTDQDNPTKNEPWCWKCKMESSFRIIDQWWVQSASCLCFVCCGFDIDEISTSPEQFNTRRTGSEGPGHAFLGPRRVLL